MEMDPAEDGFARDRAALDNRRAVQVVIYGRTRTLDPHRIWVNERSTFGDVLGEISTLDPTLEFVVLQAFWGPTPYWTEANPGTLIEPTCQMLYTIAKQRNTRYIIGVVRTSSSDYPIVLFEPDNGRALTVSEVIIQEYPELAGHIRNISSFSTDLNLIGAECDYDALKKSQPLTPPVIVVTTHEPSEDFLSDSPEWPIPPHFQAPHAYCNELLRQAYDLDSFALQTIHLSNALLHIILSTAQVAIPVLFNTQNDIETRIEENDSCADLLRLSLFLSRELNRHLFTLERIIGSIQEEDLDYAEIQDNITALFDSLCGELPGAVNVRHSNESFRKLAIYDRDDQFDDFPPESVARGLGFQSEKTQGKRRADDIAYESSSSDGYSSGNSTPVYASNITVPSDNAWPRGRYRSALVGSNSNSPSHIDKKKTYPGQTSYQKPAIMELDTSEPVPVTDMSMVFEIEKEKGGPLQQPRSPHLLSSTPRIPPIDVLGLEGHSLSRTPGQRVDGDRPAPASVPMPSVLASDTQVIKKAYQDIVSDPEYLRKELSKEQCDAMSVTSKELGYICPFFKGAVPCQKNERRLDRFKWHLHDHMGIKPYECPGRYSTEPCFRTFHSRTALDRHVESKNLVTCECGLQLLKKNIARHRRTCNAVKKMDIGN
ncbi:hypothetical protein M408DRAFT_328325 [Serendipita vermifera MAFF 305830]|uniref:Uncharacterized protein n=1 Tax=Serendipita vermifera MAFF 305830 TaxID=933852 RepID=A0A0C3B0K2_SERVB|nr:hypothetical protein M408DRAFT_328325 [Serendipita vermifera MAFF 305830]